MNKVVELYKSMLSSVGMVVDSQGFVSSHTPGADKSNPLMIGEKRLVLPYKEQLDLPDWSKRIGFHPLLQNFSAGESVVMDALRTRANRHYDFLTGMLFLNLAHLAASKEAHKSLTPEQAKYMHPYSEADKKFVALLEGIVAAKPGVKKGFEFIRFNVVMGREWQGQKRNRVAVATFPLYDELPKENKPCVLAGQKLSIKQTTMLRSMYEFIFEHINEKGYYEFGSDSKLGPSIESLYGLLDIIIANHNKHVSVLEGAIQGTELLYIPNEWSDQLKNVASMVSEIRAIPPLEGNAGRTRTGASALAPTLITDKPTVTETGTPVATPALMQAAQQQQTTQQQMQPQQPNNPFRLRLGDSTQADTVVDPRTQLPDTSVNAQQGVVNLAGFQPSAPVGQTLMAQRQQQQVQQTGYIAPQQMQPVQQPAQGVVSKIPESAILLDGKMYIPLEVKGTAPTPIGAITHDGKLYIPFGAVVPATAGMPGQQQMIPQQQFGNQAMGFGIQGVTDPAQLPGLSQQEIDFYRSNPALFQAYLAQRVNNPAQAVPSHYQNRMNTIPKYLQDLAAAEQEATRRNRFGFNM